MLTWWFLIIIVPTLGIMAEYMGKHYSDNGIKYVKYNRCVYFVAIFILIFFSGLRSITGDGVLSIGDTRMYTGLFQSLAKDSVSEFFSTTNFEEDWGFYALISLFKQIFHADEQGLFFICAFITLGCLFIRYYLLNICGSGLLFFSFICFCQRNFIVKI